MCVTMQKDKKIKPSILPGFMELLPREQLAFDSMVKKIRESFELFGFSPLDTPIIEKAEILTAKSGKETERQMYRFSKGDNDLALRFDLTIPLARYVSQYFNKLTFPFKRYQIGKVYRGEKPQKGRFREFYQCDIDIIDKENLDLVNDAEILAVIYFTFKNLDLGDFQIGINNRKILVGIINLLGMEERSADILRAIDKLEKTGAKEFEKSLNGIGLNSEQIETLNNLLSMTGNSEEVVSKLKSLEIKNDLFKEGVNELEKVSKYIKFQDIPEANWKIDLKIARGLDYYTGTVYETVLSDYPDLGSVCGGGRYDNLAEFFTEKKLPGVGISIGLTRLFSQLKERGVPLEDKTTPTKFLILPLEAPLETCFSLATKVRNAGIPTEVYTKQDKLGKMLEYANRIGVPYVGIIGENELKNNSVTVKDMDSGEQNTVSFDETAEYLTRSI